MGKKKTGLIKKEQKYHLNKKKFEKKVKKTFVHVIQQKCICTFVITVNALEKSNKIAYKISLEKKKYN